MRVQIASLPRKDRQLHGELIGIELRWFCGILLNGWATTAFSGRAPLKLIIKKYSLTPEIDLKFKK